MGTKSLIEFNVNNAAAQTTHCLTVWMDVSRKQQIKHRKQRERERESMTDEQQHQFPSSMVSSPLYIHIYHAEVENKSEENRPKIERKRNTKTLAHHILYSLTWIVNSANELLPFKLTMENIGEEYGYWPENDMLFQNEDLGRYYNQPLFIMFLYVYIFSFTVTNFCKTISLTIFFIEVSLLNYTFFICLNLIFTLFKEDPNTIILISTTC